MLNNLNGKVMKKHFFHIVMIGILFSISFELQAQVYYSGCTATSSKQASAIGLNSSSTGNQSFASGNYATASGNYTTAFGSYVQATASNAFTFGSGVSTSGYLSNTTANSFLVGFNNSPVWFAQLYSAGTPRVGIGTKTPKYTLDVNGDANANNVYTNNIYFTGSEMKIEKYGSGAQPSVLGSGDTPGGGNYTKNIVTLKQNGFVGIGITLPETELHVNGGIKTGSLNVDYNGKMKKLELTGEKPWTISVFRYLQLGSKGAISGYSDSEYLFGNNWTLDNLLNNVHIQQGASSAISLTNQERIYLMTGPDGPAGSIIDYSYVCIHKGNLGVGTNTPYQQLDVNGNAYIRSNMGIKVQNPLYPLHVNGNSYITGNVGIGSAPSATYKLGVNGNIGCKEIIVTNSGWADYVFEPDYELRSLGELESYILENKRLPEMPSAAEVAENGVNIGEVNTLLLKKIEELTLYTIDLEKRLSELENKKGGE